MRLALAEAAKSPCRSRRGAVLFWSGDDRTCFDEPLVLGSGFNGPPRGVYCDGSADCKAVCSRTAIHAEQAALLARARGRELRMPGAIIEMLHVKRGFSTSIPCFSPVPSCLECSKLMLAAGVDFMWLYAATGWTRWPMAAFHAATLSACEMPWISQPA